MLAEIEGDFLELDFQYKDQRIFKKRSNFLYYNNKLDRIHVQSLGFCKLVWIKTLPIVFFAKTFVCDFDKNVPRVINGKYLYHDNNNIYCTSKEKLYIIEPRYIKSEQILGFSMDKYVFSFIKNKTLIYNPDKNISLSFRNLPQIVTENGQLFFYHYLDDSKYDTDLVQTKNQKPHVLVQNGHRFITHDQKFYSFAQDLNLYMSKVSWTPTNICMIPTKFLMQPSNTVIQYQKISYWRVFHLSDHESFPPVYKKYFFTILLSLRHFYQKYPHVNNALHKYLLQKYIFPEFHYNNIASHY